MRRSKYAYEDIILSKSLNVLGTSHHETDISCLLKELVTFQIPIQSNLVNADVGRHVECCLINDPDLKQWDDEIKNTIAQSLTVKANGMYAPCFITRWVD